MIVYFLLRSKNKTEKKHVSRPNKIRASEKKPAGEWHIIYIKFIERTIRPRTYTHTHTPVECRVYRLYLVYKASVVFYLLMMAVPFLCPVQCLFSLYLKFEPYELRENFVEIIKWFHAKAWQPRPTNLERIQN